MAFVDLVLGDGIWETSTTTGTGTLTLGGALAGYRSFSGGIPSGKRTLFCVRDANSFEISIGTPSGSSLTREQVISSTNNNGPVNFQAGTKDVFCDLAFNLVALTYRTNVFSADQDLNGNKLIMDPSAGSDIRAPFDNLIDFYASSAQRMRIDGPNAIIKVYKADDGAGEGPELRLYRNSASPTGSDNMGVVRFTGNDSSGTEVSYAKVRGDIISAASGSPSGRFSCSVLSSGSQQEIWQARPGMMGISDSIDVYGSNKTASNRNGIGWELYQHGAMSATVDNGTPLYVNRKTADGNLIELYRDATLVGLVSVTGGTVGYGTFTGQHWSEWAVDAEPIEVDGTVVCAADGLLPGYDHLPLVRPSTRAAEDAVYGVVSGRQEIEAGKPPRLMINSLGTYRVRVNGPVRIGDLLETSDIPGVARAQTHNQILSSTIGKATQSRNGSGVVPCVLYCG